MRGDNVVPLGDNLLFDYWITDAGPYAVSPKSPLPAVIIFTNDFEHRYLDESRHERWVKKR